MSRETRVLAYTAFAIVCLVWGTTYLAIAIANETLPVLMFAGTRFTVAGAILLGIGLLRGKTLPKLRKDWLYLVVIGVCMVGFGNIGVVWAEHHLTSGFAALLVGSSPFWMAVLERFRPGGASFNARKIAGLVIGFTGLAILVGPEIGGEEFNIMFLLGVISVQVGSIGWNVGSILSKYHVSKDIDSMISAALQMLFGGIIVTIAGLASGELPQYHFTTRSLAAFLYLLFFGSVLTYGAYVYALSKLPTSTTSLYAYINPVVAVFLGWLVLSEPIGWNAIVGMLVIFIGVGFVQATGNRTAPIARETQVSPESAVVHERA